MRSSVLAATGAFFLVSLVTFPTPINAKDTHGHRQRLRRQSVQNFKNPLHEDVKRNASVSGSLGLGNAECYKLEDKWHGDNFFNGWNFFNTSDPTHGRVNYVTQETASAQGLAYVKPSGAAVMKVDSTSDLAYGVNRNSVRISTEKAYDNGLFILDAVKFPYGCAVWPAWWMVGPHWPSHGEIDIFEGVNLNTVNQYTAHTAAGCSIDTSPSRQFEVPSSSATLGLTDCGPSPSNSGCDYVDKRQGSYGPGLNAGGGAVLALQWESDGMKIWNFPRGHVPLDLTLGIPKPELWSNHFLKGAWQNTTCPTTQYFSQMSMVFDITLCGDWAGNANVYGSSGCPGNCTTQVMKGSNFENAIWEINYVAVYTRS